MNVKERVHDTIIKENHLYCYCYVIIKMNGKLGICSILDMRICDAGQDMKGFYFWKHYLINNFYLGIILLDLN